MGFFTVLLLPSTVPYSIANEGSNGLSNLYSLLGVKIVYSEDGLKGFDPQNSILVVARSKPLEEVMHILELAENGVVVVVYGSPEHVIEVLKKIGINAELEGYVRDAVFNVGFTNIILVNTTYVNMVFENPYALRGNFKNVKIIAWSSIFSHVDLNRNNLYDLDEPIGSLPLGLEVPVNQGKVIIFFTEYLLENSVLEYNLDFVKAFIGNKTIIVDQSEMRIYLIEVLRILLLYQRGALNIYVISSLMIILTMVAYIVTRE